MIEGFYFTVPYKLLMLFCAQEHWALEPGRLCFGCREQCMGICCRLGPGVYLQSGFTSEGLTLVRFNSIILLFIFSLSHVRSFRIPGGRTRAVVGWKEPRVRNRRKQVFTGLCERLGKYHLALCVVIELWFRGAVPVAQDEQERRMNLENQICMSTNVYACQVCLALKRCTFCNVSAPSWAELELHKWEGPHYISTFFFFCPVNIDV